MTLSEKKKENTAFFRTRSERSERSVRATNKTRLFERGSDKLGGGSCTFAFLGMNWSEKCLERNETQDLSVLGHGAYHLVVFF